MTTKALCCLIVRRDGETFRSTGHDVPVEVTDSDYAGDYRPTSGISLTAIKSNASMAPDNMEVSGALAASQFFQNQLLVTAAAIEGGLWDQARVSVFEVDVDDTSAVDLLLSGVMGEIVRTHEGTYTAEVRNLFQLLSQNIGEKVSITCRATFGSGAEVPLIKRCGLDITALAVAGELSTDATIGRQHYEFTDPALTQDASYFRDGVVTWVTGLNAGYRSQVRRHLAGGRIVLDSPTPFHMEIGDTYSITPGCNKLFATCKAFGNGVNFKGEPYLPGIDAIIAFRGEE